ncbi:MAG: hypothetical protein AAGD92_15280, partial [Pseudomonadota bacterium]
AVFTRPIAAVEPCGMAETSISATQRDDLAGPAMRSIGDAVQRRSAGRKASCFIVVDVLRPARPLRFLCVRGRLARGGDDAWAGMGKAGRRGWLLPRLQGKERSLMT